MRKLLLFAALPFSACAAERSEAAAQGDTAQPIPVRGETPGHRCTTAGTDKFIGRAGTPRTGRAIRRASRAAVLRWAPPGAVLTMDFRADRVTVYLGPDHKVTKIQCG